MINTINTDNNLSLGCKICAYDKDTAANMGNTQLKKEKHTEKNILKSIKNVTGKQQNT